MFPVVRRLRTGHLRWCSSQPSNKYLIIGLGNPGKKYENTRHNMGAKVVDGIAKEKGLDFKEKFDSLFAAYSVAGKQVWVIKPQTFMNLSGNSVKRWTDSLSIPTTNCLIVYDTMHMQFGLLRLREKGGSGGHNGVSHIHQQLKSEKVPQLRVGVGIPAAGASHISFVLEKFSGDEMDALPQVLRQASDCVQLFISENIESAMNKYNNKKIK